jgi:hypothetical protein
MDIALLQDEREALVRYAIEHGQMPRYLYKYWSTSSVIRFLGNHKIMFSQYTDFNDPFECAANIDANNSAIEWADYLASQGVRADEIHHIVSHILADRKEAAKTIKDAVHTTIINSGIFCMTPKPDNLLMWVHYADQHKGACIKFDLLSDIATFNFPKSVDYSDDYYSYNYLREQGKASMAIWHKSKEWAYEEEYRIVKPTFHGLVEVNPNAVVEVIFGCRCSTGDENAIRAAAGTGVYNNLTYRHAQMSTSKYQLEII